MTPATSILVKAWFLFVLTGIGLISVPIVRREASKSYLVGFILCVVALAPQAPLMFLLGWTVLANSTLSDPMPTLLIPALLGMAFGPAALIVGTRRLRLSPSGWLMLFGVACSGVAVAVGSFTAFVFMITV